MKYIDLPGQWSIYIMQNGDDFYIIDMALASQSALIEGGIEMTKDKDRYALNKSAEDKYLDLLSAFIDKLDSYTEEGIDNIDNSEFTLELSDTELNPYTLKSLLEMFGYKEGGLNSNGWQWDYSWKMENEKAKSDLTRKLVIWGTGITFELKLSNDEFI